MRERELVNNPIVELEEYSEKYLVNTKDDIKEEKDQEQAETSRKQTACIVDLSVTIEINIYELQTF